MYGILVLTPPDLPSTKLTPTISRKCSKLYTNNSNYIEGVGVISYTFLMRAKAPHQIKKQFTKYRPKTGANLLFWMAFLQWVTPISYSNLTDTDKIWIGEYVIYGWPKKGQTMTQSRGIFSFWLKMEPKDGALMPWQTHYRGSSL